jgi:hypothetical protein
MTLEGAARTLHGITASPAFGSAERSPTMNDPIEMTATRTPRQGGCLVEGCTCRDARIVSRRRAAFFAWLASERGQSANREIAPDPGLAVPWAEGEPR